VERAEERRPQPSLQDYDFAFREVKDGVFIEKTALF
jgi:hypothetical protein